MEDHQASQNDQAKRNDETTSNKEEKVEESRKEGEEEEYWCSWCFKKSSQELLKHSYLFRNLYRCTNCEHLTLHCFKCKIGKSSICIDIVRSDLTCTSLKE